MSEVHVIGLGQPIVDLSVNVSDEFLKQNFLQKNNAIRANEEHENLFKTLWGQDESTFIPGGSTTNTLRILSQLLKHTNKLVGCIGKL